MIYPHGKHFMETHRENGIISNLSVPYIGQFSIFFTVVMGIIGTEVIGRRVLIGAYFETPTLD